MILITGATGFLGAELVFQLLQTEERVRCIRRENSLIPDRLADLSNRIDWQIADILDYSDLSDSFEDVTKVYHCAALVSFDKKLKQKMLAVNAEGTENVVNLCIENDVAKLIHVSSIAALGNAKAGTTTNESSFWEGFEVRDAYAVSKYRAEMEVWRGMNEGLKAIIVNPSVIIGADAGTEGSGAIFQNVKEGINYFTQGETGFVDVKDVASCMILLMQHAVINQRFILNSENLSYKELFNLSADAFEIPRPKKLAKPWILSVAWRFSQLMNRFSRKKGGLNRAIAKTASKVSRYDNSKVKSLLNFDFIPVKQSVIQIAAKLKSV